MKKILMAVLVMVAVVGVFSMRSAVAGDAQLPVLISPSTWVLGTNAVEVITVHVSYPYRYVENVAVFVSEEGSTPVPIAEDDISLYYDNRGELVIKFVPDVELYEAGDNLKVTLDVYTVSGAPEYTYGDSAMQVTVKDAGVLTAPIE